MGIMAQPWKDPKTGVYKCRLAVPQEIQAVYGKSIVKKTLGTKDAAEARKLFPSVYSAFRAEFDAIKAKLDAEAHAESVEPEQGVQQVVSAPADTLTARDVKVLAARYYNAQIERMYTSKALGYQDIAKYDLMAVRLKQWSSGDSQEAGGTGGNRVVKFPERPSQNFAQKKPEPYLSEDVQEALAESDDSVIDEYTEDGRAYELPVDTEQEAMALFADDVDAMLEDEGYNIPRTSTDYKRILIEITRSVGALRKAAQELVMGAPEPPQLIPLGHTPLSPSVSSQQGLEASSVVNNTQPSTTNETSKEAAAQRVSDDSEQSIVHVFKRYQTEALRKAGGKEKTVRRTLSDYASIVRRFNEFIKSRPVSSVTKRDVVEFRDLLLQLPSRAKQSVAMMPLKQQALVAKEQGLKTLSASTVRKQLMALSGFFEVALEYELVDKNPVRGVSKRLTQETSDRSGEDKQYSNEELRNVFALPLFTEGFRPRSSVYGEAVYWLPLLAYYTGARAEELAQLYVRDVKKEQGIHYLHIIDDAPDKTVKNKGSVRKIPLHEHLIDLGFVEYVQSQSPDGRLFPKLKASSERYAGKVSLWLGKYFRENAGLREEVKAMHGLRHAWSTLARNAGIPKDVRSAITGHSSGDVSDTYGEYSLELLYEAVNKIPRLLLRW